MTSKLTCNETIQIAYIFNKIDFNIKSLSTNRSLGADDFNSEFYRALRERNDIKFTQTISENRRGGNT